MFANLRKIYASSGFSIIKSSKFSENNIKRTVLNSYNDFNNQGYFKKKKGSKKDSNTNITDNKDSKDEKELDENENQEKPKWMRFFNDQFDLTYDIDRALVSYNQGLELVVRYIKNNYKNFTDSQ